MFSITDPTQKENLGIIVHYKVKVKLCLGPLGQDVVAELPFVLMHPKPLDEPPPSSASGKAPSEEGEANHNKEGDLLGEPVDHNLIQLDA